VAKSLIHVFRLIESNKRDGGGDAGRRSGGRR
jgi:hypothetical protein